MLLLIIAALFYIMIVQWEVIFERDQYRSKKYWKARMEREDEDQQRKAFFSKADSSTLGTYTPTREQ